MAASRTGMEKVICRMIEDGKSNAEIARLNGVNYKTVVRYRKMTQETGYKVEKVICSANYPPHFKRDWTVAVNRLRRYMGKRTFPMPKED